MTRGYQIVFGSCWLCHEGFTFNADHVPSIHIDPQTGRPPDVDENGNKTWASHEAMARAIRQPLCLKCVTEANEARIEAGKEPMPVHPDAYEPQEV